MASFSSSILNALQARQSGQAYNAVINALTHRAALLQAAGSTDEAIMDDLLENPSLTAALLWLELQELHLISEGTYEAVKKRPGPVR